MADFEIAAKILRENAEQLKEEAAGHDRAASDLRSRAAELEKIARDQREAAKQAIAAAEHLVPPAPEEYVTEEYVEDAVPYSGREKPRKA